VLGASGIQGTDPLAALSQWDYDLIWGVHLATDPNGNAVTANYDAGGLVSSIVDPRSTGGSLILTQYAYDTQDRLTTRTDPLSHDDTVNTYDGDGNVLTATDRNGQGVTYTWDALNRIASATYDDGHAVAYTWDDGNRLTDIDDRSRAGRSPSLRNSVGWPLASTRPPAASFSEAVPGSWAIPVARST
jgi:YD repeat-containing protein